MKKSPNHGSLGSLSLSGNLGLPLSVALAERQVIRVEIPGQLPYWFAAGPEQKQALITRGAPPALVWTLRELESLPWGQRPLTLGAYLEAFQAEAPAERLPVAHA
jgi:hypothetical protein